MDEWLTERFEGDGRAMRERGRDCWWLGWTLLLIGVVPLIFLWHGVQLPVTSPLATIRATLPLWLPSVAMGIAYIGVVFATVGW